MKEINEKDLEQAMGGANIWDNTIAEIEAKNCTPHDPLDGINCAEYVQMNGLTKCCAGCKFSVISSTEITEYVYCMKGL